jgi:hypothetical protein
MNRRGLSNAFSFSVYRVYGLYMRFSRIGPAGKLVFRLVGVERVYMKMSAPSSRPPITLAPIEDFRRDSDLFGEGARDPEAGRR